MRTPCSPSLAAALLLGLAAALPAQVPENFEARERFCEAILGTLRENASAPAAVLTQADGPRVLFRTQRSNGALYSLFLNEQGSAFPIAGSGSWVIKRAAEDGGFLQAKVFYRSDEGCFVRLSPSGSRTLLEAYLFGVRVARRAQLPVAFATLLTLPFSRIRELSGSQVRWDLLLARGEAAASLRQQETSRRIRAALGGLRLADDGAMDEEGRYVRIADSTAQGPGGGLNCSGFAKWVVDGFYGPLAGGGCLPIAELKTRHPELRGSRWSLPYEEQRDPYFGLDWARNLAAALARAGGEPESGLESHDVRRLEYLEYREDVGYSIEELELALFLDAVRNPGCFYIGSINRELGGQPMLRQHYHLAVFLPYFTPAGDFRVAVFEAVRESSLQEMRRRFAGHYVHLERLSAGGEWVAPRSRP
jgi:hypothetical protein